LGVEVWGLGLGFGLGVQICGFRWGLGLGVQVWGGKGLGWAGVGIG
jgi:hypothetical protein